MSLLFAAFVRALHTAVDEELLSAWDCRCWAAQKVDKHEFVL